MIRATFAEFVNADSKAESNPIKIVAMVAPQGRLIIATETAIYEVRDGALEELQFEVREPKT